MSRWLWLIGRWRDRIWFRAAVISFLAVVLALAGALLAPIIPYEWGVEIGGEAVDTVLSILASSMLAVTTFSLTAMVTAFSGASEQITPRAVHLLIEDRTAQNALSTFLGGFVFALVSIVALTVGIYGDQGRVILFAGTIVMAIAIVLTLLRWIARLVNFGRVDDAIALVERKTASALASYPGPLLLSGKADPVTGEHLVKASKTGHVVHIDRQSLSDVARARGAILTIAAAPGAFVSPVTALVASSIALKEDQCEAVRTAFAVERNRNFDQDPGFGILILAEIGMRALSPAVNDPGTANAAVDAAQRTLDHFAHPDLETRDPLPGLVDPPLSFQQLVEELVLPLGRDGAPILDVAARLQAALGTLAQRVPAARLWLAELAAETFERSRNSAMSSADLARLEAVHRVAFD